MAQTNNVNEEMAFNLINKSQVLSIPAHDAKDHTLKDLGLDSLDLISLSMLFEDELKLKIDTDNITTLSTLSDLINGLQPMTE